FELPKPNAIPVAASAIGTNQHSLCLRIQGMPHLSPPAANALHGKTGRVMRAAYGHPPQVEFRIVDTTRNRLGDVRVGEIMHIDLDRLAFRLPFLPGFPVVSDQFLLLGVDRNDWPASAQERLALALDVTGAIPKCGHVALVLDCCYVDICVIFSSSGSLRMRLISQFSRASGARFLETDD